MKKALNALGDALISPWVDLILAFYFVFLAVFAYDKGAPIGIPLLMIAISGLFIWKFRRFFKRRKGVVK